MRPKGAADPWVKLAKEAVDEFLDVFGGVEPQVAVAPGRVNLIGDHTDYNEGFVLPMAIDRGVAAAFRPRLDGRLRVHAAASRETREMEISRLAPAGGADFLAYAAGVVWAFREAELPVPGLDLLLHGNLPIGAGLASSAALELAVARALAGAALIPWEPLRMAKLAQQAESRFAGVSCGLMDQLAAAESHPGCAMLLDCRSLERQAVPIPTEATLVAMDTGVRRSLADSAYNERRASCAAALAALAPRLPGARALRDVDEAGLEANRDALDPISCLRARHVVAESRRPPACAAALRAGDLAAAGRLMNESHASLRDLFAVSCPELDLLTELARRHEACFGARMTGAGFGGSAVALVRSGGEEPFMAAVARAYARAQAPRDGALFVCRPSVGAHLVALEERP